MSAFRSFPKEPTKRKRNHSRRDRTKEHRSLVKYADGLMAQIVKLRDANTCQRCGRMAPQWKIDAAHIYAKGGNGRMRFILINLLCLCFVCHDWWHKQSEGMEWFRGKFPERYEKLQIWRRIAPKVDIKETIIALEIALEIELKEARADSGRVG